MLPTFRPNETKEQHVQYVAFSQNASPQCVNYKETLLSPAPWITAHCWLACCHFQAKCQGKRNALVYEHLDGEQRNKK